MKKKLQNSKIIFHAYNENFEIMGCKISKCFFYTTNDKKLKISFVINLQEAINLNKLLEKTKKDEFLTFSEQQYLYVKWLSQNKRGDDITNKYAVIYNFHEIYYEGLKYRVFVEKQDHKIILFELIQLISSFPTLYDGYNLILYLTFLITDFSFSEKEFLLSFYKSNKIHFLENEAYSSVFNYLTKNSCQIQIVPALFENNKLSKRENELLMYYIDTKIISQNKINNFTYEKAFYSYIYSIWFDKILYQDKYLVPYNKIVLPDNIKKDWNNAKLIIQSEKKQIINFNKDNSLLTEIEILSNLPQKLLEEINPFKNSNYFGDISIKKIEELVSFFGYEAKEKYSLRQFKYIADACSVYGYAINPNPSISAESYNNSSFVYIYKKEKIFQNLPPIDNNIKYLMPYIKQDLSKLEIVLNLNSKNLSKIISNTKDIQFVLNDIFKEEEQQTLSDESKIKKTTINNNFYLKYEKIIKLIINKEQWLTTELKKIFDKNGLMINSAIDSINEWSEEQYGDFLIEGDDDNYIINKTVVSLICNNGV